MWLCTHSTVPPVTPVVARWGGAVGAACRRVCYLPRDRRGRRLGGEHPHLHTPRWVPWVRRVGKRNLFRCDRVKLSLSLSELAAPLGLLRAQPANDERTLSIEAVRVTLTAPAHRGPCRPARAPHGPHTPHKNLVTPRRARRHTSALTSGPPERARTCTQYINGHKFECALGHGRSPTSQHWGFRLRLARATPQGAPAAAMAAASAASLSLF